MDWINRQWLVYYSFIRSVIGTTADAELTKNDIQQATIGILVLIHSLQITVPRTGFETTGREIDYQIIAWTEAIRECLRSGRINRADKNRQTYHTSQGWGQASLRTRARGRSSTTRTLKKTPFHANLLIHNYDEDEQLDCREPKGHGVQYQYKARSWNANHHSNPKHAVDKTLDLWGSRITQPS